MVIWAGSTCAFFVGGGACRRACPSGQGNTDRSRNKGGLSCTCLLGVWLHGPPAAPPTVQRAALDGYWLYYGPASGNYTARIDVGPVTTYTVTGLVSGQTYYFAVAAYDRTDGSESVKSNEVSTTLPPSGETGTPVTVTFDNPVPPGSSGEVLNGLFQGIDFGSEQWRWESAAGPEGRNAIYFDSYSGNSRTFTFAPAPRTLVSLRVFTEVAGRLTVRDDLDQTMVQEITTGAMQLVTTGW